MIAGMTDGRAVEELVVGVLGGTGPQGRGLAVRLAAVGQRVLLETRDHPNVASVSSHLLAVAGRSEPATT